MPVPDKIYLSPKGPGTLSGLDKLTYHSRLPRKKLSHLLQGLDAYTLHKPAKKHFNRRNTIVSGKNVQFAADLLDLSKYKRQNKNYCFILTVIDIFSKFSYAVPLKTKKGSEVAAAFKKIFDTGAIPHQISTDRGLEFWNSYTAQLFKKYRIKHFATHNYVLKQTVIERFNKRLQNILQRFFTAEGHTTYIDKLQTLINNYNKTYHNSIERSPSSVTKLNQHKVWYTLYHKKPFIKKKPAFKIGDTVRVSLTKKVFAKGFEQTFSDKIFSIYKICNTNPITYKLKDKEGNILHSTFYKEELQLIKDKIYKIKKILYSKIIRRKKFYRVSWVGYPSSSNTYLREEDLKNYL